MLTGRARLDLSKATAEQMRPRLSALASMPDNTEVVVNVGTSAVEPAAVRVLRDHERRLRVVIEGSPFNVPRWLAAVRTGFGELIP